MLLQTRASLLKRGSALEGKKLAVLWTPINQAHLSMLLEFALWLLEIKVLFLSIISG
jgi:hypothetical protein